MADDPLPSLLPFLLDGAKAVLGVQLLLVVFSSIESIGPIDYACAPQNITACKDTRGIVGTAYWASSSNDFETHRVLAILALTVIALLAQLIHSKAIVIHKEVVQKTRLWLESAMIVAKDLDQTKENVKSPREKKMELFKGFVAIGTGCPLDLPQAKLSRARYLEKGGGETVCNVPVVRAIGYVVALGLAAWFGYVQYEYSRLMLDTSSCVESCCYTCSPVRQWFGRILFGIYMFLGAALSVSCVRFRRAYGRMLGTSMWGYVSDFDSDVGVRVTKLALVVAQYSEEFDANSVYSFLKMVRPDPPPPPPPPPSSESQSLPPPSSKSRRCWKKCFFSKCPCNCSCNCSFGCPCKTENKSASEAGDGYSSMYEDDNYEDPFIRFHEYLTGVETTATTATHERGDVGLYEYSGSEQASEAASSTHVPSSTSSGYSDAYRDYSSSGSSRARKRSFCRS